MEDHQKHSLGHRAFLLFLMRRIRGVILLGALIFAVWYGERWMPQGYLGWGDYAVRFLLIFTAAYFFFIFVRTALEYRYYTYTFTEDAFVMTYGYIMRNEIAALYHQVQNVNIHRAPLDRLVGVSQIVIFMTGSEKDAAHNKIVLPAVGKTKAKLVQKEILARARRHMAPAHKAGAA